MKKRIIATLLALVMCLGLLPLSGSAGGEVSGPKPDIKNVTYTNENPPRVKVEFANGEGRTWFELYAIKEWKEGDPDAIGKLSIDGKIGVSDALAILRVAAKLVSMENWLA